MLLVMPTPLGNLKDMTYRAVEELSSADVVLCEDTRQTLTLLNHYGISCRVERYNEHNDSSVERALGVVCRVNKAVLVSDRGTPCVSDPGWKLIAAAVKAGVRVEALPGACAATVALSGSGLPAGGFVFLGFLPRKRSKITAALQDSAKLGKTMVVYESPFRIKKLLEIAAAALGPDTGCVLARELTKVHEEWLRGTLASVLADLSSRKEVKGEIVLMINPAGVGEEEQDGEDQDFQD